MPTGRHLHALTTLLTLETVVLALGGCDTDKLDHQGRCPEKVQLTDFDGDLELLRGYTRVGGDLTIPEGTEDLSALACLEKVDGVLTASELPELESLEGLENLREVGGLSLSYLPHLHSLAPLSSLQKIEGGLYLGELTGLEVIDGLTSITEVRGIELRGWPQLREWEPVLGGEEINSIWMYWVPGDASISALSGFSVADEIDIAALPLEGHPEGATIRLDGLTSVNRFLLDGIDAASIGSLGALTDVGSFNLVRYGGRDLAGLTSLHTVELLQLTEAPRLESLAGLESLMTLTGLSIRQNPVLTQVDALAQLRAMPFIESDRVNQGALSPGIGVSECPLLADLSGLSTIDVETLPWLYLDQLPALTALPAFVSLPQLGELAVKNTGIHDLDGLGGVGTLSSAYDAESLASGTLDDFSVELAGNLSLVDVSGLMGVTGVGVLGDLRVVDNPMLPDCDVDELVDAFEAAGRMDGMLEIANNGGGC